MHLKIKLYAGLEAYLPGDAVDNSSLMEIDGATTVHDVIDRFKVPRNEAHLILLNGVFIIPDERDKAGIFKDGDTLALWPKIAGGGVTRPNRMTIRREMAITHAEFFRLLPAALRSLVYKTSGNIIHISEGVKTITIELGEESSRKIASLSLPVTKLSIRFTGYSDLDTDAFLRQFERAYQKGGG